MKAVWMQLRKDRSLYPAARWTDTKLTFPSLAEAVAYIKAQHADGVRCDWRVLQAERVLARFDCRGNKIRRTYGNAR